MTERILNSAIDWAALTSESEEASSLKIRLQVFRHLRTIVRLKRSFPAACRRTLETTGRRRFVVVQFDDEATVGLLEDLEQLVGDLRHQGLDVRRLAQGRADVENRHAAFPAAECRGIAEAKLD